MDRNYSVSSYFFKKTTCIADKSKYNYQKRILSLNNEI